MPEHHAQSYTAFDGDRRLATGPLPEVALAVIRALERGVAGPLLTFDDATGRAVDFDTRGSDAEVIARLSPASPEPRGPGRPKLGVIAREVTLLPRHWDWLAAQPGGASVALRKLIEEARRGSTSSDRRRVAQDTAYRFMAAMAGDRPGFEEAARALYADDPEKFRAFVSAWPKDVGGHVMRLAYAEGSSPDHATT